MFFLFEVHGFRPFRVALNSGQAMATLFFVTFGGMACTVPQMITGVTQALIKRNAHDLLQALRADIAKYGGPELEASVGNALDLAVIDREASNKVS